MQQVMAEFVREGEVDPPFRADRVVVNDSPTFTTGGRTEKRAVEIGEIVASDTDNRVIGESLGRVFLCHHRDIDWKPVDPENRIEQTRDFKRPTLRGEDGAHSFSPIRSTIRRILSLVVGSIFRYF